MQSQIQYLLDSQKINTTLLTYLKLSVRCIILSCFRNLSNAREKL